LQKIFRRKSWKRAARKSQRKIRVKAQRRRKKPTIISYTASQMSRMNCAIKIIKDGRTWAAIGKSCAENSNFSDTILEFFESLGIRGERGEGEDTFTFSFEHVESLEIAHSISLLEVAAIFMVSKSLSEAWHHAMLQVEQESESQGSESDGNASEESSEAKEESSDSGYDGGSGSSENESDSSSPSPPAKRPRLSNGSDSSDSTLSDISNDGAFDPDILPRDSDSDATDDSTSKHLRDIEKTEDLRNTKIDLSAMNNDSAPEM
jgi:hypothetical protein